MLLSFVVGFAIAGVGGGAVGGMLSFLVLGSAYLFQNGVRRRRGTLPAPPPRSPTEQAQSDALFLRIGAATDLLISAVAVVVLVGRGQWFPGRGWTALLLLGAACGLASAPYLWAIAELRATERTLRWAWGLSGALDVVFGAAAATIAITNLRSHWLGGATWSVAIAALAFMWLLGAVNPLTRAARG